MVPDTPERGTTMLHSFQNKYQHFVFYHRMLGEDLQSQRVLKQNAKLWAEACGTLIRKNLTA